MQPLLAEMPMATKREWYYNMMVAQPIIKEAFVGGIDINYPLHWISRGGLIPSSAEAQTPCDFNLRRHIMKSLVYSTLVETIEDLLEQILQRSNT